MSGNGDVGVEKNCQETRAPGCDCERQLEFSFQSRDDVQGRLRRGPEQCRSAASLEPAAEGGNWDACFALGNMCRDGRGVAQDRVRARALFQRATNGGHLDAVVTLGTMYRFGEGGAVDWLRARDLSQLAMNRGSMDAAFNLGVMARHAESDEDKLGSAAEYFSRA